MPIYVYEGRDRQRRPRKGKRMADSRELLGTQLMKEGITPINIELITQRKNFWKIFKKKLFERKVSLDDLTMFSRQMYTLSKTGVPIASAIKHLADSTQNKTFSEALFGLVEHLEVGEDIASSMEYYPEVFTNLVTSIMRVGSNSGRLSEAFFRINQYLTLENSTIKDVKSALRYPIIVLLTVSLAVLLINIFVVPAFDTLFASQKIELPLPTRILIVMSDTIRHHYILLFGSLGLIIFTFLKLIKTARGKFLWDKLLWRAPIVKKIVQGSVMLRFSQTFAMTLESGVQLTEAITLVADAANNEFAKSRILSMRDAVEHGNTLTQAATRTKLFNPLELQMLSTSEETGELSPMLTQIAEHYKMELEYDVKRLGSMIEPILLFVMAGVVLMLALAVYLPVWNMTEMAQKGQSSVSVPAL